MNKIVIKWKWNNCFSFIIPDTNPYCNLNLIKFAKFCDVLHYHDWIRWFCPWVSASKKPYLKTQSRPRERVRKREEVMQMLCRQEKWQLKCPAEMLFDGESILVSVLDLFTLRLYVYSTVMHIIVKKSLRQSYRHILYTKTIFICTLTTLYYTYCSIYLKHYHISIGI